MKKIIFYSFDNYSPFLEINNELIQEYLNKNYKVYYFFLGHKLYKKYNFIWPRFKIINKFFRRFLPEIKAINLLRNKKNLIYSDQIMIKNFKINQNKLNSTYKIKKLYYKNFDVGEAILSNLVSFKKVSSLDFSINIKKIKKFYSSAISLYQKALDDIDKIKPSKVYVFNGRFVYPRSIIRACQSKNIRFGCYDKGVSNKSYRIRDYDWINKFELQKQIQSLWKKKKNKKNFKKIYKKWFEDRKSNKFNLQTDQSYTLSQNLNFVKSNQKKIISFFTSSDDEKVALGSEWISYFGTQVKALEALIASIDYRLFNLVIRVHPNVAFKAESEKRVWKNLKKKHSKNKNIQLILYDDKIKSYSLLDESKVIVTTGSTIGIEATFYSKPSILLSPSQYDTCKGYFIAKNNLELKKLLKKNLKAKNKYSFMPAINQKINEGTRKFRFTTANKNFSKVYFKDTQLNKKSFYLKLLFAILRIY